MAERGPIEVVIGVLTYRRPEMLAELLDALPAQIADAAPLADATVLVVDNDPDASAREAASGRDRVRYVHEPIPGIAAARHRCLAEADAADLLQFIDDDELPEPEWLRLMVQAWQEHGRPAAVAGAVLPRFVEPPDAWLLAGEFFTRAQPGTGTVLPAAPTGNLLIDVAQAREMGVQFDLTRGLRGGEDTLFTRQLVGRGGRIIFCREAAISDLVPPERATRRWVLARARHHGGTATELDLLAAHGPRQRALSRAKRLVGGLGRAAVGSAGAVTGRDAARHAKGLRLQRRGLGMAQAAIWPLPPEYRR